MNNNFKSVKRIFAALVAVTMVMAFVPSAMAADSAITLSAVSVLEDTIYAYIYLGSDTAANHALAIVTANSRDASYSNAIAMGYGATETGSWIVSKNTSSESFLATGATASFEYSVSASGGYGSAIEIKMPDSVSTGTYKVTVGVSGGNTVVFSGVEYVSYADRLKLIESIAGESASAENLVSVLNSIPVLLDVSGSNSTYYTSLDSDAKLVFAQYIIDNNTSEDPEMSEFGELANEAFIVAYVNAEYSSSNKSDRTLAALGLDVLSDNAALIDLDISDERFTKISDAISFYKAIQAQGDSTTIEGIASALDNAMTFERLNEAGYLVITDVVSEYNDFFGADEDELAEVSKNDTIKNYFGKAMKDSSEKYSLPVYTLEDFQNAWDRAYEDAVEQYEEYLDNKTSSSSGSSGGGSSSSSGSSSSKTTTSVTIDQSTVREDPLKVKKMITDYYDDMSDYSWAESAVLALTEDGIVSGTGNMKFEPARTLTREEFMKILVNTFSLADMKATTSFTDVTDTSAWYYVYIASAEKAGITSGRGDGTFGLGDTVTREEMATLVYRAAVQAGVKLTSTTSASTVTYSDISSVSSYALEAINALTESGIMNGSDGKFSPQNGATRAEAAVVINNIKSGYLN